MENQIIVADFRLPRMRGDRPLRVGQLYPITEFTPHARGSTAINLCNHSTVEVYPACAGIDPFNPRLVTPILGLPRMRGDRPPGTPHTLPLQVFTPHARGSTVLYTSSFLPPSVYPACAGIDRDT